MFKRISAVIVSIILAVGFFTPSFKTSAESGASFSMKDVENVSSGTSFSIEIFLESPVKLNVCAINFSLGYNSDLLECSYGALTSSCFKDITYNVNGGKVNFVWDAASNLSVQKGRIITVGFKAADGFSGETNVTLKCISAYSYNAQSTTSKFTSVCPSGIVATAKITSGQSISQSATELINKIAAIGNVEATDTYKAKLDELLNEYKGLSYTDKNKITNYQTLVDAYNRYTELVAKNNVLNSEINKFLNDNSAALALRASTVNVSDKGIVDNALNEWSKLSVQAQVKLTTERNLLKNLSAIITELDAENQKKLAEEKLKQEAEQAIKDFKELNGWVLELKDSDIRSDHREGLKAALDSLAELEMFNDLAYKMLVDDGTLARLTAFYETSNRLYMAEHPADAEYIDKADNFRASFGYVLGMTPESLTYEDMADVNLAYTVYSFLDPKTQSYLVKEAAIIEELMKNGENLSESADEKMSEETADDEDVLETVTETKTNYVTNNTSGKYDLEFANHKMSNAVWVLLIIEGVAVVFLAAAMTMFYLIKKKDKNAGGALL